MEESMPQAKNTRREIIGAGAAVAAIAAVGLPMGATMASPQIEGLAALISRYFAEVNTFNATPHRTDKESTAHAKATYEATLRQMIGMPAHTTGDALAALDWLTKEGADFSLEYGDDSTFFGRVVTSLVDAIRGYIVSTGRLA
jgi:secreted PhoX family phosphatase